MEFPYLVKPTELGSLLTPYCWIEVKTQKGVWRKQKFLFDTGADYTSVPKFMSAVVGVDLITAKQEIMYTADNQPMVAYLGKMRIRLDGRELTVPCVFTDHDDTPFLLGRAGLIDRFEMLLSARQKALVIEK